jgi:hypothetical protein
VCEVEGYGFADEVFQGGLVELLAFVDVHRPADVSFEAGVEEACGVLQRRLREGQLN